MHPVRLLSTSIALSLLVEATNITGAANVGNLPGPKRLLNLGSAFLKASLISQLVIIFLLYLLSGVFHHRGTTTTKTLSSSSPKIKTKKPLFTLYTSTLLILARTVYRLAEHTSNPPASTFWDQDFDPAALSLATRSAWYFYVFEASLMLANMVLWNIWHPGRFLPEDKRVYLAQDGETEIRGPGWKDERFWNVFSCFDPLGVVDTSGTGGRPFWEDSGFAHLLLERGKNEGIEML